MSHPNDLDLGPLAWVKTEIDAALARADESLALAADAPDAPARVQFAQTHLHQARGALSIVGLDGLTQVASVLDQALGALARGERPIDADALALARRALATIGNYLDELAHGTPDQPLRLLALYREIAALRGTDTVSPADLFFPDLSVRPRIAAAPALDDDARAHRQRAQRAAFQRGLLQWLRNPDDDAGAAAMRDAVAAVEALHAGGPADTLWYIAHAFLDAVVQRDLPAGPEIKRLCSQLDAQLKRLADAPAAAPDRLLRELLYWTSEAPARSAHQRDVRAAWRLDALIPEPGAAVSATPLAPLLKSLHGQIASTKIAWDGFSAGRAADLPRFDAQLAELAPLAAQLGRPALDRLLRALQDFVQWLRRDPLRMNDATALEVATALLLAETALERGAPDAGFSAQAADTEARLRALMRGETVAPAAASPTIASARRSQEREALRQLSREILSSLAQVEQILDDYFRNQQKQAPLATLAAPLKQVEGALTLVGDERAIALVHAATATIARFADAQSPPPQRAFEALARELSALGFYVEALQHGPAALDRFLEPAAAAGADLQAGQPESAAGDRTGATPADAPVDAPTATDVPPCDRPAGDFDDAGVLDRTAALLDEIDLELPPLAEPEPAADTAPAAGAPEATPPAMTVASEDVDAELLAIFIEEAHDVLATIERLLADGSDLAGIRRGFHTLKGSGRMVGLRELGDAAWGIEQTLNRWLQLEWAPTPALRSLVGHAHRTFSDWVRSLEAGGGPSRDVAALMTEADRLRSSETPLFDVAADASAPQSAAEPAAPEASGSAPARDPAAQPDVDASAAAPYAGVADVARDDTGGTRPAAAGQPDVEPLPAFDLPALEALGAAVSGIEGGAAEPPEIDETGTHRPGDAERDADRAAPSPADGSAPPTLFAPDSDAPVEMLEALEGLDLADEPVEAFGASDEFETLEALEALELPDACDASIPDPDDALARSAAIRDDRPAFNVAVPDDDAASSVFDFGDLPDNEPAPAAASGEAAPAPVDSDDRDARTADHPDTPTSGAGDADVPDNRRADIDRDVVVIGDTQLSRPLYDLYLAEARHHLAVLHAELARLSANPTLVPAEQALRAAHTLAGISGTTRIAPVLRLARALEHAIERLRDHDLAPTAEQAALLNTTNDTLEAMLADVTAQRMPLDVPEFAEQLDAVGREVALDALGEAPFLQVAPPASPPAAADVASAPAIVHDDLDGQLLPIFVEEGAELVAELHAALRAWQAGGGREPAHAVARLLHTLKGSARMAGAMTLGELVHQLESRLQAAQDDEAIDAPALIDELVAGLDHVEQMFDRIAAGEPLSPAPSAAGASEADGGPAPTDADATAGATLRVRAEAVDRFVNEAGEIGIARTRIAGELRTMRRSLLDLTENVIRLRNQLREVEIQADVQMQSRISQRDLHDGEFDPLEMDRYTRLQELTRMMAESVGDVTTVQQNLLRNLDATELALNNQARLSRDLQQSLMQVRMVPFESLADRLHRVVRQTAKELGKRANLDLRGGRIEIDRSVLEHMTAPLEHLLRNAVAHGIEPPARRRDVGKDEIGQIALSIAQEGNEIAIVLADDGAGLDFERIAERARAGGLLAADEPADERRLTNLIFVPGFSTAGNLSAVSGRGVGMDVVKSETAAVGGRIDVHAAAGRGTEFRIYLPLTLAVTQALLIRAAGRSYAVPSTMVAQVLELKSDALEALRGDGGTDWQGQRFTYRYLPQLLGDRLAQPELQRFNWVLLLRAGAQTLALHVDALRGNQEIVVKHAGPQLARIVGIAGATVLGDGEIVLILNPVALASRSLSALEAPPADAPLDGADGVEALEPLEPLEAGVERVPTVMVVDDSLTVRKITGRLLEREGFRVIVAKDGVDALERLIDAVPDVILSDIEMPRMDGFDLLRNIRADARLRDVPVVMITSRLADKHRQYAEKIGANHYLGKPYDEAELLGLLRRYTAAALPT